MTPDHPTAAPFEPWPADPRVATATPPKGVSTRRAWAALVVLAGAAFLFVTNEIAPIGLITLMSEGLDRSESEIGLLSTVFAGVVMLAAVPLALVTTRLPRRPVLVGVATALAVGTAIEGTAHSYEQLAAGRALTAMAHALFWAVVTPAAAGMFPAAVRGKSVSRLLLGAACAGVIGLPAATWLGQRTDWQVPFLVIAVAAVAVAALIWTIMPNYKTEEGSAPRGEIPSGKRYARILVATGLVTTAMAATWTYIKPFFEQVTGFSPATVPTLLFFAGAIGLGGMWLAGIVSDKAPVKSVVAGVGGLVGLWGGYALFGGSKAAVVSGLVVQGIAWSVFVAAMVVWAMRHSPWSSDLGVALYASVFNGGNALGSYLGSLILADAGAAWLPVASVAATLAAFALVVTVKGVGRGAPIVRARR